MKNKGFTLVELLAVIAILAILVIVAMPNVLGMFNQAKVNSFVTEVQKIMDTATTTFTRDALKNSGKTVYYSSENNATLKTKPLDMSGNKKNYFIEMDRNGNFKRVIVSDDNYCYDIYADGTKADVSSSKTKFIDGNGIDKTSVVVEDISESGNDSVSAVVNASGNNIISYSVIGCEKGYIALVPENGLYIDVDGNRYNPGDPMPTVSRVGDQYLQEDYIYHYGKRKVDYNRWETDATMNGWGVELSASSTQTSYSQLLTYVNQKPVVSINWLYSGAFGLTTTPVIPKKVREMSHAFEQAATLTTLPLIPDGVVDLNYAFSQFGFFSSDPLVFPAGFKIPEGVKYMNNAFASTNITYAPEIPSSVISLVGIFKNCKKLTRGTTFGHLTSISQFNEVYSGCESLVDASNIAFPVNAWNMNHAFYNCKNLVNPPDFSKVNPSSSFSFAQAFMYCENLTGTIEINAENISYGNSDFYGVTKPLTIIGKNSRLNLYASSNITVIIK